LAAVLRSQRSGGPQDLAKAKGRSAARARNTEAGQAMPGAVESLGPRLLALAPQDPARRHKALRMFIEATLLDDLGAENAADPEFQHIVDRATRTIEEEPELRPLLDEAMEELLG
jgi:hypothetical protein